LSWVLVVFEVCETGVVYFIFYIFFTLEFLECALELEKHVVPVSVSGDFQGVE
jgi:hypothetical protein